MSREDVSDGPRTAGPVARRADNNRYRSSDTKGKGVLSSGRLHQSGYASAAARPRSCFGQRDLKPPHHPNHHAVSASTDARINPPRGTPDGASSATITRRFKEASKSPTHSKNKTSFRILPSSDDADSQPRYCVISSSSAGTTKIRESANSSAVRHRKEVLSQRASNSYVITADTASLLVQSKSAPIFRSVSDVGTVSRTKSSFSDAYYYGSKSGSIDKLNNVSSADAINNDKGINVKSKSAHARTNATVSDSNDISQYPSDQNKTSQYYAFLNNQRVTDEENQRRGIGHSTYIPYDCVSNESSTYFIALQRVASETSLAVPHYGFRIDENSPLGSLMPHSSNLPSIYNATNSFTASSNNSSTTNNKWNIGNGPVKAKSKPGISNSRGHGKTVIPSKHGYHPRSNSPTFKRLVAAAERLEENYSIEGPMLSPSVSKNMPEHHSHSDTSSDSLRRHRYFKDYYLNGFDHSSDESTVKKFPIRNGRTTERSENLELRKSRHKSTSHHRISKPIKPPCPNENPLKHFAREKISPDRPPDATETEYHARGDADGRLHTPVSDDTCLVGQEEMANGTAPAGIDPPKEPERRIMNGQPTQLHFFLPQLADNMSEASGGTLTGRSYYQEQRIELLNRNELQHDILVEDKDTGRGRDNKPRNSSIIKNNNNSNSNNNRYPQPGVALDSKFGKTTATLNSKMPTTMTKTHLQQSNGQTNGLLETGPGQHREKRTSSQSPGRADDPSRSRRYVSPMRSKNPVWDNRPTRRKPQQSNYKLVPYENMYLESQLPSEKLKKQIDNFPTLVSMEFSGNTTPCQSR